MMFSLKLYYRVAFSIDNNDYFQKESMFLIYSNKQRFSNLFSKYIGILKWSTYKY